MQEEALLVTHFSGTYVARADNGEKYKNKLAICTSQVLTSYRRLLFVPVARGQNTWYARAKRALQCRVPGGEIAEDILAKRNLRLISGYQGSRLLDVILPG